MDHYDNTCVCVSVCVLNTVECVERSKLDSVFSVFLAVLFSRQINKALKKQMFQQGTFRRFGETSG